MSVAQLLLHEARQAGVELRVVGGRLQAKRRSRLRPDLLEALCRHKAEVVKLLKSQCQRRRQMSPFHRFEMSGFQ